MNVSEILEPSKASIFLPGEIGEVDARVVMTPDGPRIALVAYQCKVLTPDERNMLASVRHYIKAKLEAAKYRIAKSPDGQE